ncbi:MAG TPA: hypothetical protein VJ111_03815 [Chitinophagaceae bacterium]|nr:hypothetical protein [Chitinophagaceae bacterium]
MNPASLLPSPGSHFISLNQAISMTSLFRSQKENILAPSFQNLGILPICETFSRYDVDSLLTKQSCEALRVYLGMDEENNVRLLIVAVNEKGEDILPVLSFGNTVDEDIVEEGHRCPPSCPPSSPLNT